MYNRKRRKNRRRGKGLAVLLILLVCIAVVGGAAILLRVADISVEGSSVKYSTEEVLAASGIEPGSSMLMTSSSKIEKRILDELPYLLSADVSKRFPDRIVITISDNVVAARVSSRGKTFLIDSRARVIDIAEGTYAQKCPTVTGFADVAADVGDRLSTSVDDETRISYLKDILAFIVDEELTDRIQSIDLENISRITLRYDGRITVILGSGEDLPQKMQKFYEILLQQRDNARGTIDVSPEDRGYFREE